MIESLIEIKQLGFSDLDALVVLRRQALDSHPHAFGAVPEEDRLCSSTERAAVLGNPGEAVVLGTYDNEALVGMAGLARATGAKRRHKAIIWGMYVSPSLRRRGVGRMLLDGIVAEAKRWPDVRQLHLSVTEAAGEARRLYDSAGFVEWGREPRSLLWGGRFTDEVHLTLLLDHLHG